MRSVNTPVETPEAVLRAGDYEAVVTSYGGGLRRLRHRGRDLVLSYDGLPPPRYRGAVLVPWPNRVVDGSYEFDGRRHQLHMTEPDRRYALHGLVSDRRFDLEAEETVAVARMRLEGEPGYPWPLELVVTYSLEEHGLTWMIAGHNLGSEPAPYGAGFYPYLVAGPAHEGSVDEWTLRLSADRVLLAEGARLLPREMVSVSADLDLRGGAPLAGRRLDHAFTALAPDRDGWAAARLSDPSGSGVEIAWDAGVLPWVHVFTGDVSAPEVCRAGVAVEPMTCPPDSFNSGTDLVVLPPGGMHRATCRMRAL